MSFEEVAKRMQKPEAFAIRPRTRLINLAKAEPTTSSEGTVGAYVLLSLGPLVTLAGVVALLAGSDLPAFGVVVGVIMTIRGWRMLPDGQPNQ